MPVTRLNHAVLHVRDLQRSVDFYSEVLGLMPVVEMSGIPGAAFLRATGSTNDHDLGLFALGAAAGPSAAGRTTVGLYHLAWEVDTLAELVRVRDLLASRAALGGASDHATTKSLYGRDPDGLELEVVWVVPAADLTPDDLAARAGIRPLDLKHEIGRFGASTRGGIGISALAHEVG